MLKDLTIETSYDTNIDDDVLLNFYIPILSESISYKRMAGYFRSSSLAVASRGISKFIENGGHMQILACPYFSEDDLEVINRVANDEFNNLLTKSLINQLTPDIIEEEHVEAMGWMLANGYLEIRIVLVEDKNGNIVNENIFHSKVGIVSDGENTVVFSGSINESMGGWESNIENFEVYCDWKDPVERIEKKLKNFDIYWKIDKYNRKRTVELPEAVKKHWIKSVPKDKGFLKIFKKKEIVLRGYQKEAISKWFDNKYRGIFNMATGTGKTITAIFAIKRLLSEIKGKYVLIVAVPFQHLIQDLWEVNLRKYLFEDNNKNVIIKAYDSSDKWNNIGTRYIPAYKVGVITSVTVITTYDTLHSEKMISFIDKFNGKKILIADEAHNAGATDYREGLRESYEYRLGLSATPARYWDEGGTSFLRDYFEKEVYIFSLFDAITKINPDTGKTFLAPYEYHPVFVSLNDKELSKYREYSKNISYYASRSEKLSEDDYQTYLKLLSSRSRILKNADNKINKLFELIPKFKKMGVFNHCLIYCSDGKGPDGTKTIYRIVKELNDSDISNSRFTSQDNMARRETILKDFSNGIISTIVAIKCLDEGVDVPATRNAIIMSSTSNPREYIQRRGRILRRCMGKEKAILYDFMIIPNNNYPSQVEIQILRSEYKRFKEFSNFSLNKKQNEAIMNDISMRYGIELGEENE